VTLNSVPDAYHLSVEDGIATVTFARPARMNALHPAAHHALCDLFDRLAETEGVRVVIVTGEGKAFCAGYDLKDSLETEMQVSARGFAGLGARTDYPLPLIAAVNGVAMGGGFETALACDIIVAAESARFALPEAKVGWAALGGGIQRLPRAIGVKRAMDIILTGRTVSAAEGHALGFVSEVAPDGEALAVAKRWAAQIVACAPLAIRCSKASIHAGLDMSLADALDPENYPWVAPMMASEDSIEGRTAFAERRSPVWKGR
jgi:enoyl-CoA hydratase/carnithine racemase